MVVDLRRPERSLNLIVGLGNPGRKYHKTRHNVGFMILDALNSSYNIGTYNREYQADVACGKIANKKVLVAKPASFMNLAGIPVRDLFDAYGIKSKNCVVIHDDMDLALGRIKIKEKGGHGGHKGIQSLIDAVGDEFIRLRIGIGRPTEGVDVVDHVLGDFSQEEFTNLKRIIDMAQEAVLTILCQGAKESMNRFNAKNNQHLL
jgi:PTH1 family peptidyl-tRNA hydrolase